MRPRQDLYDNPRVAAGYAFARPAVHPRILQHVRDYLGLTTRAARALDIGCGAGRSTAALDAVADAVVGIDPAVAMMEHRRIVAPRARFVAGQAERLPFASAAFDLITAAGSMNYADVSLALPEIARVLAPAGTLVLYDFSAGRRCSDSRALDDWYGEFDRRYPAAPGYGLDVARLPFGRAGLALESWQELEIAMPMTLDSYLRYALSETRIEVARSAGVRETDIREWCRLTLETVFGDEPRDVIFEAYVAYSRRGGGS
jgi:SAM-dependent methyltransferase